MASGLDPLTQCPSESRWYEHFTLSHDRAYTIEVLHKLLALYESEWTVGQYEMPLHSLCACMFLLVSSLGGMRGFEVMWTDLAALRYDLDYCVKVEDYTAVSWPIVGQFKAHDGRLGCYMIPIAGKTQSGIEFYKCTQRFVGRLAMGGHYDGWAFKRKDGTCAKASDYINNIYQRLYIEHIQATTSLIDRDCDVRVEYRAQRSGRRFLTTHATMQGVSPHIIELQCRWQTDPVNGERSVSRSMIHLYSEIRNMKKTLIQPSLVCRRATTTTLYSRLSYKGSAAQGTDEVCVATYRWDLPNWRTANFGSCSSQRYLRPSLAARDVSGLYSTELT
jgi:hypothetical protein